MTFRRLFGFCAWAVLPACLALALDRLRLAVSFTTPWQISTSSPEEEDLFSIWKFAHGQAVYNDPTQIPFSLSVYNWLFFDLYGAVAACFLHWLHLGDIWLPNVARLLTFFFALAAAALYFVILRRNAALRDFCPAHLLAALGLIAVLNPLFGFWVMTARPDLGALAFELAGVFFLLVHLERRRLVFALAAGVAFYLAWSFKQTAITGLAAASLTLLFHRRLAALALLALPWIALVALTLFLGGHDYRYCLLVPQTEFAFHFRSGVGIFFSSLAKMPLIVLALLVLVYDTAGLARRGKLCALPPGETVFLFATVTALMFGLATAGKGDAAGNYFFPLSIWSSLWLFWTLPRLGRTYAVAACLGVTALMLGGIALVFLGRAGMIDRRDRHEAHLTLARKLPALSPPICVEDIYGDLPWIQPYPPYFVVTDMYPVEESSGAIPRSRGLNALKENGYFSAIVLFHGERQDDALLARYRLADSDAYYDYYVRK